MPKRPFEVERGQLVDWVDRELGRSKCVIRIEPMVADPPEATITRKNRLLRLLKQGATSAARELGEFDRDAEVRKEVLRAFGSVRLGNHELENLTEAMRALKLVEALPALERLFRQFVKVPIEPGEEGISGDARALLLVTETILALDPESMLAAEYLAGALKRAAGEGRDRVLRTIASAYRPNASTPAFHLLRDTIRAELKDVERLLFPEAFEPTEIRSTLVEYLAVGGKRSGDVHWAAMRAYRAGLSWCGDAIAEVVTLRRHDVRCLAVAEHVIERVDPKVALGLVEKGLADEAPRVRWAAVNLLSQLQGDEVASLARKALEDEPDEWLQRRLREIAG